MNTRSIRFRLTLYHVCLLALILLVFASAGYWGFRRRLTNSLEAYCASQSRQIAESLLASLPASGLTYLGDEIQEHYAPEANNLFIRIVSSEGTTLYESGSPQDKSFIPPQLGFLPNLKGPWTEVETRQHRLVFIRPYSLANGGSYQIQIGASLLPLEKSLEVLWKIGLWLLPLALVLSAVGGFFLIQRSLKPVREVVATARRINSSNLRERLIETQTHDEIQDLTKTLNQMFERLDASFKQMVRFTADASHELRTPLTVIRGNLELLLRDKAVSRGSYSSEELQETLAQTLEETERLSKIVSQLLELTQLDSGEIELEREVFDLTELVATTAEQMNLLAEDKGIRLGTDLAPRIPFEGDRSRLKQVLLNLIDNAIKYCPVGSAVEVRLFNDQRGLVLEVKDNGPGIPADAIGRLCDRFYRVDKVRSRELGGSGLGLSICRSICEAHGGRIEVDSRTGVGSTFRVVLPASPNDLAVLEGIEQPVSSQEDPSQGEHTFYKPLPSKGHPKDWGS
jgi:heavy metal sensor kinase